MARTVKPLTDKQIKNAQPHSKEYKLFDGGGLYLSITSRGQKWWRLKYLFNGKEKRISLGVYPATSLSKARQLREENKAMVAEGIDPSATRKAKKEEHQKEGIKKQNTFHTISQKWLEGYTDQVSENYHIKLERALENYVYPSLESKQIDRITRLEIIAILEDLKARKLHETARRTAMLINKVFKYAVTHEYAPRNIVADIDIKDILGKKIVNHYPTLTKEEDIRGLLLAIDDYAGHYSTKMALKLLSYLFVRSYNIRHMEWSEIDFTTREWIIPAKKMKGDDNFTLPLPSQVILLLKEAKTNSLSHRYVLPSFRAGDRPLSDNTLISALRRMGYTKDELVPHSFRSIFSTIAHEWANRSDGHSYTSEVIEACMDHRERNAVKAAYNRSNYREPMRGLMQWYANHLDQIKIGTLHKG